MIIKLTKKDLENMAVFNKNQKRIGEPKLTEKEYLQYIYGKLKYKPEKKKLKSFDIPNWAVDVRNIKSVTSDHIAVKKQDGYKKEISKQYPVAPPANKMGYQLLLNSEIKTAGRKI